MRRTLLITTLCLLAGHAVSSAVMSSRREVAVVAARLNTLPTTLDGWRGKDDRFQEAVYQALNADETLLRLYQKPGETSVWLYIGYYGTNKGGRTGHQPTYCYPGAGWNIEDSGKETIRVGNTAVRVNRILVNQGDMYITSLYWNQTRDQIMDSGWQMNVNRFRRRVLTNRDDGAFVRLSTDPGRRETIPAAIESQKKLAGILLTRLPHHWPQEREVPR